MSNNYGYILIIIITAILLILQLLFNFKTNKVLQIILAVTYAIDLALYITLTVYVYQRDHMLDYIGSMFKNNNFKGFADYFETKFDCCGYYLNDNDMQSRCKGLNKESCSITIHNTYEDNREVLMVLSLISTLILVIILAICILYIVVAFLCDKQAIENDNELTDVASKDEKDPENPKNSKEGVPVPLVNSSKDDSENEKNKNAYIHLSNGENISESEASQRIEQEVFFGKPKFDPYEADPFDH